MEDKKHGLTDMQDGEFMLNESGTTISIDQVEGVDVPETDKPNEAPSKDNSSSAGSEEKDITV